MGCSTRAGRPPPPVADGAGPAGGGAFAGRRPARRSRRRDSTSSGRSCCTLFRTRLVLLRWREQPAANVVGDGPEPRVADPLAVHRGHMVYLMPHDEVGSGLVLRLVG